MPSPVKIFVSYAKADEPSLVQLETFLTPMVREGSIEIWSEASFEIGMDREEQVVCELLRADIVLLLVSPQYMSYPDRIGLHLAIAMQQQADRRARVIPVMVRPADMGKVRFAGLAPLPHNETPVNRWPDQDEAWLDVAKGIRRIVESPEARSLVPPRPGQTTATTTLIAPSGAGVTVTQRIKVLFLVADPKDAPIHLRLGTEARDIAASLRDSDSGRASFELVHEWAVRPRDLQAILLRHQPQVVHFSGHGGRSGSLAFEDDEGNVTLVNPAAMAGLFKDLGTTVRCVVLNACYSEEQAKAICQHVDCVVGMHGEVGDAGARAFATSFYRHLGYNKSVMEAFEAGRNENALEDLPDEKTPVLHTRAGVDPARIKLIP